MSRRRTALPRRAPHAALAALTLLAGCASGHGLRVAAQITLPVRAPVPTPRADIAPAPAPRPTAPVASPFAALPGWNDDATAETLPAWRRTCERLLRTPGDRPVGHDAVAGTVADWQPACRALPPPDADDATARAYFERWFVPSLVTGDDDAPGLFTGYYEPELHGARTRDGRYTVPLYGRPRDLVTDASGPRRTGRRVAGRLRPYWTRAQIVAGALGRRTRPLLWVDDAVEAFFLEIQGSGRVVLADGSATSLNYAAANGHPYVALGRVLIERGALAREEVSLQSIRAWLLAHPREARAVMNQNPSYVFFRENLGGGARGSEGVALTPGRSLAVDTRYVPLGVPLFLDVAPLEGVGAIRRLVVAQDTGGAIRGPVRGDVFWGAGPEAYDRAGRMRQAGRYWILVPQGVTPPVSHAHVASSEGP